MTLVKNLVKMSPSLRGGAVNRDWKLSRFRLDGSVDGFYSSDLLPLRQTCEESNQRRSRRCGFSHKKSAKWPCKAFSHEIMAKNCICSLFSQVEMCFQSHRNGLDDATRVLVRCGSKHTCLWHFHRITENFANTAKLGASSTA